MDTPQDLDTTRRRWVLVALALVGLYLIILIPTWIGFVSGGWPGFRCDSFSHGECTVADVLPGGPGDRAGLRSGDVLVELSGRPATILAWFTIMRAQHPGDHLILGVRLEHSQATKRVVRTVTLSFDSYLVARTHFVPFSQSAKANAPYVVNIPLLIPLLMQTVSGLLFFAIAGVVILMRPTDHAAKLLLVTAASLALMLIVPTFGLITFLTQSTLSYLIIAVAYLASQEIALIGYTTAFFLFLSFPAPQPALAHLRIAGPYWLRRVGGGIALLYCIALILALVFGAYGGFSYPIVQYSAPVAAAGMAVPVPSWYGPAWFVTIGALLVPVFRIWLRGRIWYLALCWLLATLVSSVAAVVLGPFTFIPGVLLGATLLALIHSYLNPPTLLARAQLTWIVAALTLVLLGWAVVIVLGVITTAINSPIASPTWQLSAFVLDSGLSFLPLVVAIGFAVLRYRLFDVHIVVRATLVYPILAGLIVGVYLVLVFVLGHLASVLVGYQADPTIAVIAALAVAVVAYPARQSIQGALDRLVYRDRHARRRYLDDATDELGRARPLDAVASFLTGRTASQLDLAGAWLALPDGLSGAQEEALPAAAAPVFARLRSAHEPVLLVAPAERDAWPESAVVAGDAATASWLGAGARLLVPLRVSAQHSARTAALEPPDPLVGVWVLGARRSQALFDREDLALFARVGEMAAVLLDYERLHRAQIEQAVVQHELERAAQIQRNLLPATIAGASSQVDLAACFRAAQETSGDFYDVLALGAEAAPALQVVIGDVAGKGIAAALVMAMTRATLRAVGQRPVSDAAIASTVPASSPGSGSLQGARVAIPSAASAAATLRLAGRLLYHDLGHQNYVACVLGIVEPATGPGQRAPRLMISNAGQTTPLLYRDGRIRELQTPGEHLPLGVLPDPEYGEIALDLEPGDAVIFASDGLPEATNGREPAHGEMFGFERLASVAASHAARASSAEAIAAGIWAEIMSWAGDAPPQDDMTLFVLRVPEHRTPRE
jgi:serine phosphatase RsbU (regulator of sigma subunit)